VLVSPVPGNPIASGTALRNALSGIASPSSTNPWLVKVEPGIYDIGTTSLPMRAWVDVEGSGSGTTTIQGNVNGSGLNAATINGADNAELRDVTVLAAASGATTDVIAFYNPATSPRLYRVKLAATGRVVWGLRNATSAPRIEECEITATSTGGSGSLAYGVVFSAFSGLPAGRSSILRSKIKAIGALENYGVYMGTGQIVTEIRNSRIDASGGTVSYGLYATPDGGWTGSDSLALRDTEVSAFGGSNSSYGVRFESGANLYLSVVDSLVWGHGSPSGYGVVHLGGNAASIQASSLVGATKVADVIGNISIASTSMSGGPVTATGWLGCIGVWDENAIFYANSCPP
jgi:hypothetical protein